MTGLLVMVYASVFAVSSLCFGWASRRMVRGEGWKAKTVYNWPLYPALVLSLAFALMRLVLFERLGITPTMAVTQLPWVMAVVVCAMVFRERLRWQQWIGAVVIAGGAYVMVTV